MQIPKHELYDFSAFPVIQEGLRDYATYGTIIKFSEFIEAINELCREVEAKYE